MQVPADLINDLLNLLLQTLPGAVVAVLAAFLTYALSRKREKESAEQMYIALLQSVYAEVDWLEKHAQLMRSQLEEIKKRSVQKGEFVVSRPSHLFNTQYLDQCRLKLSETEKSRPKILVMLSTYINALVTLNHHRLKVGGFGIRLKAD